MIHELIFHIGIVLVRLFVFHICRGEKGWGGWGGTNLSLLRFALYKLHSQVYSYTFLMIDISSTKLMSNPPSQEWQNTFDRTGMG